MGEIISKADGFPQFEAARRLIQDLARQIRRTRKDLERLKRQEIGPMITDIEHKCFLYHSGAMAQVVSQLPEPSALVKTALVEVAN
jgi:polyhydroxyalkanoate synthesis regulator phasin